MMDSDSKIYVAGHRGMVGSAIVRELKDKNMVEYIIIAFIAASLAAIAVSKWRESN